MVTFADLRQVASTAVRTAGQVWWDHAEALSGFEERMNDAVARVLRNAGWTGEAATAAVGSSERIESSFQLRSYVAELVAAVHETGYERLWRLQWQLTVTVDAARSEGLVVRDDGVVEAPAADPRQHGLDGGETWIRRGERARELTEQIVELVAEADDVDYQCASALSWLSPAQALGSAGWQELTWDARGLAAGYGLSESDIPAGGDPQANAAWWERLTPAEQVMYVAAYPERVGGLDGLPVTTRDRANQLALHGVVTAYTVDNATRERARRLLDQVEASEHRPAPQHMYLIGYDLAGDGRAVISVGNPDTADHTAVWIPGIHNTIDDIGPDLQRVSNLQARADQLTQGPAGDVATVMWLGYDTPGVNHGAVGDGHAEAAAPALDGFIDGLRTTDHEGRISVVGHSYGSVVVGEAASTGDGLAVDDIIVAGSPGMGVGGAGQLQVESGHVWAGSAAGDDVSGWLSHFAHGPEPHQEGFGANRFVVDTTGHSDYWRRDTLSLENQAMVIIGEYEQVQLEHGAPPR